MTNLPTLLLARLDAIGESLARSGHALALIGLGSVGTELARLDAYSDLDFFAIVEPGYKERYIEQLDWLSALCPIVYCFRNTADGYKLLFADGIFCEFAVFAAPELPAISFAPGRLVWKAPGIDDAIAAPARPVVPATGAACDWLVNEALTNLYVGMGRFRRGEKLSAQRFIQHYAVDHIVALAAQFEQEQPVMKDLFTGERRFELRFPGMAQALPHFMQGYARSSESALAILAFLEEHFAVNPALAARIRRLCAGED